MSNCDCIPVKLCLEDLPTNAGSFPIYPTMFHNFYEQAPPKGWRVRNGEILYNADIVFPELWAALEKPENAWKVKPIDEWSSMSEAAGGIGGVPYFVLDIVNRTIKLPDTRGDYEEGAGFDGLNVGEWHTDAIRNIKGTIVPGDQFANTGVKSATGVFKAGATLAGRHFAISGANSACDTIDFDASRVLPTANKNQPRAFGVLPCVYVGR